MSEILCLTQKEAATLKEMQSSNFWKPLGALTEDQRAVLVLAKDFAIYFND